MDNNENKEINQQNETENVEEREVVLDVENVEVNEETNSEFENQSNEGEVFETKTYNIADAQTESVSYETEQTEPVKEEKAQPEKPKSTIQIFFENLYYKLSYSPALGFVGVMSVITFLGFIFFVNTRKLHEANLEIANSCLIMQFFFGAMFILFLTLFIVSIALNVIRRKQGKR